MKTITMPSFGADMAEGTLIEWQVQPGDLLTRGQVVAVIETNKGAIELDLFEEGSVDALLLPLGASAKVGTPILRLRLPDEEPDLAPEAPPSTTKATTLTAKQTAPYPAAAEHPAAEHQASCFIVASPAARAQAQARGVSLANLAGSGPSGAIVLADLPTQTATPTPRTAETGKLDLQAMRQAITATVTRSKREIPHYYLGLTLSLSALDQQVAEHNRNLPPDERLLLIAPLLCAVARTLKKHSLFNGQMVAGLYQPEAQVNLANAVALRGGGLIMPVIQQADALDAASMMRRLSELVEKARHGNLRHSELSGASCTVSSIGERGADQLFGVIYPPQVAIIGLGRPRSAPWVVDNEVRVGRVMTITLAADHRVSDGHQGALFLHDLDKQLQQPEALWTPLPCAN